MDMSGDMNVCWSEPRRWHELQDYNFSQRLSEIPDGKTYLQGNQEDDANWNILVALEINQ